MSKIEKNNDNENHIPNGYVMISRYLYEETISTLTPCARELYFHFIIYATHKFRNFNGIHLKQGQLLRSHRQLMQYLDWKSGYRTNVYSSSQVKTAMKNLKDIGLISTTNKPKGILITVNKYGIYQDPKNYGWYNVSTNESSKNSQSTNQEADPNNNNVNPDKNSNHLSKKKLLSEIELTDELDNYTRIAYQFWQHVVKEAHKTGINLPSIENADCESWILPIKELIEKHKKTEREFKEVFQFVTRNEWWKDKFTHTQILTRNNKNNDLYFDYFLFQMKKEILKYSLPTKDQLKDLFKNRFIKVTDRLVNLFLDYLKLLADNNSTTLKNTTLEYEINQLAKHSKNDTLVAVNILKAAIKSKKRLAGFNIDFFLPSGSN